MRPPSREWIYEARRKRACPYTSTSRPTSDRRCKDALASHEVKQLLDSIRNGESHDVLAVRYRLSKEHIAKMAGKRLEGF